MSDLPAAATAAPVGETPAAPVAAPPKHAVSDSNPPVAAASAMPAPAAPAAVPAQPFRPLNVKDALSYLDRVKLTFTDQAEGQFCLERAS